MNKRIATIKNGKIYYGESSSTILPSETSARENRQAMKTKHRKELLQPNETAYYKEYPQHMKNLPEETQRLLS